MKTKLTLTNTLVVAFLAGVCCLLWGSAFPFIKIGYNLFDIDSGDSFAQILFAGIRFSVAGVLVIIIGSIISKEFLVPKSKNTVLKAVILCVFQTILQYVFFYIGLAHTTGVKSSIFAATNVFFALIISAIFIKSEKLSAKKIVGAVIGFLGVVLINLSKSGFDSNFAFNGEGFIILCSIAYAVSSVLIKLFSRSENTVLLSGWQFLFGGIIMALIGLLGGGRIETINLKGVLMLVYLAFVSAFAYTLWGILLKHNEISKVSVFGFMNPVFGFLLSALFLNEKGEAFTLNSLLALVLVCLGIYIVNGNYKKVIR